MKAIPTVNNHARVRDRWSGICNKRKSLKVVGHYRTRDSLKDEIIQTFWSGIGYSFSSFNSALRQSELRSRRTSLETPSDQSICFTAKYELRLLSEFIIFLPLKYPVMKYSSLIFYNLEK